MSDGRKRILIEVTAEQEAAIAQLRDAVGFNVRRPEIVKEALKVGMKRLSETWLKERAPLDTEAATC